PFPALLRRGLPVHPRHGVVTAAGGGFLPGALPGFVGAFPGAPLPGVALLLGGGLGPHGGPVHALQPAGTTLGRPRGPPSRPAPPPPRARGPRRPPPAAPPHPPPHPPPLLAPPQERGPDLDVRADAGRRLAEQRRLARAAPLRDRLQGVGQLAVRHLLRGRR